MPRNSSGTYTLPSGNPVVSGTVIESTWANSTLGDLASAITDSLSRSGEGGMTAPLRVLDGTVSIPGLGFANETGSGLYRAAAGDVGLAVLGSRILRLQAAGASVTGTLGVSGATTLSGTLDVTGVATLTANPVLSAGTANGVPYLNGSKSLTSGSSLVFDGSKLGIGTASPYSTLDVGTTGAQSLTSLFTTGVDDLKFRIGAINGVAGSTGTLQGQLGLFYLGSGEVATIGFVRGGGANDGSLTFRTNGNERVRIDSSGNVGIGTSSPTYKVQIDSGSNNSALRLDGSNTNNTQIELRNSNSTSYIGISAMGSTGFGVGGWANSLVLEGVPASTGNTVFSSYTNSIVFQTNGRTERARIDSSGNLCLSCTGISGGAPNASASSAFEYGTGVWKTRGDGQPIRAQFFWGTTQVGSITVGSTSTAYSTSSDYRLKENVAPMQNALATVAQLKPCTYTWKADGSAGQGFIAHELQAVVPDCVTGEKDAVRIVDVLDDEGKVIGTKEEPQYQGVDTSFLVATLVAAIQELNAKVEALETVPAA